MKKNTAEENTPKSASLTEDSKISGFKGWLPVIGLTFSTFIFNTSEFIPIGLLSDIAGDFHISESHAGLMITVYAWVVALASLPLMLAFAKTESRKLMLSIVTLFIVSYNHANESRQESKRKASFLFKTKSDKYSTLTHTLKAFKSCLNTD